MACWLKKNVLKSNDFKSFGGGFCKMVKWLWRFELNYSAFLINISPIK